MFKSVEARYVLRCVVAGVIALLASLQASSFGSSLTLDEVFAALIAGLSGGLAYAGIGWVAKPVEPSIGNKQEE